MSMDLNKESPEKKPVELVLVIPEEPEDSTKDPKVESLEDPSREPPKDSDSHSQPKPKSPFPEIKASPSPSTRKPPKPPQPESLIRRRSMPSSAFVKPKSRFIEQSLPAAPSSIEDGHSITQDRSLGSPYHGSPNPRASGTPKKPNTMEEEEEEAEIYKEEMLPGARKWKRKWKVRIFIEWAILVLAMGCLTTSLTIHWLQNFMIWGLEIWKWCLMVMVICCGRLVTQWLITCIVFLIEKNFLLKKKVLYFVVGLKNSVRVCVWLSLVLLSWALLFNSGDPRSPKTEKILNYVSRFLVSLLIGSVLWLIKIILVKILASSFHVNTFFDRIQESIFHQYVLQVLSGPPVMELAEKVGSVKSTGQLSFRNMGKVKEKDGEELGVIDVGKLHKMRQEKVSAWTMKGLVNVIKSSGLTTISNAIDESFDEMGEQRDREITSEWEAKTVAYRIFKNVAKPGHKYIDEEDLMRFLSKEEVETVLPLFEGAAETRKIKKSALKNWVVKAYFDRKSLAHSLNDTKTAVKQLHNLATAVVIVIIIIVTLLLMGFATTQVLVLLSSQILLLGFMFQNTCKMVFEALIFVFVMHPFDVGDRCVVDGVQMIVEEMNILTTVLLRYDNEKIYYPNSVLATKPISNFYRSPEMSDSVEFSVDFLTSMESIAALKTRIKMYLESKPNHWYPTHSIEVKEIVNIDKMNMALYVKHTMNFQNIGEKRSRRTDLILELKKIFEELSIQYHLLPQEVQLSYIGPMPASVTMGQRFLDV